MREVIVSSFFLALAGCSQLIELQNDSQEMTLNYTNKDVNDAKFYMFQQECSATIEKINKNSNENYQQTDWMKILTAEGEPYFSLNWKFLKEKYGGYLSQAYNWWLNHLDKTERIVDDAALLIDHDRLRIYIIELEKFIDRNPKFVDIEEVKSRLSWYLNIYLSGLDNTPIYDRRTHTINQEVRLSYEKFLSENRNSKYCPLVKKLYETIKRK